ncbi:MAG: hypothetical protein A2113_03990 [Candidatus Woykebacteria bacterium GWA1_44_8]|uniref:Uncharacterized protein n=1 Tax=Candidatus Woykebacteria bacterium GWA1_44_8 TaxID=1802591 RepID=A0A1G1W1Y8_9BACT|nr:MAG: hypothetical protein A2113_03990 [Candidatus Woykebacteria bacterium GWA1_44_8]
MIRKLFSLIGKNKIPILTALVIILVFGFLFRDVLFFGKTLRGEPFAGGVVPSGPASYTGDTNIYRFLADPGASSWNDNPPFVIAANQIKEGYFPWWNPFSATGTPIFADLLSGVTFPLKWPLIFDPSPFMFDMFSLVRLFLGIAFTYLFLRLLKINRWVAATGAFTFGLSGALIRYANMEHLSIDALIPFSLFCIEYFIQKRTRWSWFLLFLSLLLPVLAAFPEANVFAATLTYLYFLFRAWQEDKKFDLIKKFIAANVLAFLIAAPLLLSLFQFISQAWTAHSLDRQLGLHSVPLSLLFSVVTPWVFNTSFSTVLKIIQFGQLGWFGGSILILGILGIFTRGYKKHIGVFFAAYGIISLLKTFGVWPVSLIGHLPIYNQLIFPKYNQPAITISFVLSAAIFINYLYEKGSKFKYLLGGVSIYLFTFGLFFLMSYKLWFDLVIDRLHLSLTINYLLTFAVFGLFTVLAFAILIAIAALIKFKNSRLIIAFVLLIISVEALLNFPKVFPERDAGYVPVKYVSAVQKNVGNNYRIAGKDYVLYTQIAGVYGIRDIRHLDAIYFNDYMEFLRIIDPEVFDRFVTLNENWLTKPQVLRMLGVKNILSISPIEENGLSNLPTLGIPKEAYTISGSGREIFFLHPPVSKDISLTIPSGTAAVYFFLAMNPAVWDVSNGDGVKLSLITSQGVSKEITIDPKNNPNDRIWHKVEFPVSSGQVNLHLTVDGLDSITFDWTGMSDFYSKDFAENYSKFYVPTKGFPIIQDSYSIRSYDVIGANQIAYFPKQVDFVNAKDFESEFKKQLDSIDQISVALSDSGKKEVVTQDFELQPKVDQKINGDPEVSLPKDPPPYLFISVPHTKDTRVTNQERENLAFYKSNLAFLLVKLNPDDEKIFLSNSPSNNTKMIFLGLTSTGVFLVAIYLVVFNKFKFWLPWRKVKNRI